MESVPAPQPVPAQPPVPLTPSEERSWAMLAQEMATDMIDTIFIICYNNRQALTVECSALLTVPRRRG
jgi:hypothetical protein